MRIQLRGEERGGLLANAGPNLGLAYLCRGYEPVVRVTRRPARCDLLSARGRLMLAGRRVLPLGVVVSSVFLNEPE